MPSMVSGASRRESRFGRARWRNRAAWSSWFVGSPLGGFFNARLIQALSLAACLPLPTIVRWSIPDVPKRTQLDCVYVRDSPPVRQACVRDGFQPADRQFRRTAGRLRRLARISGVPGAVIVDGRRRVILTRNKAPPSSRAKSS